MVLDLALIILFYSLFLCLNLPQKITISYKTFVNRRLTQNHDLDKDLS